MERLYSVGSDFRNSDQWVLVHVGENNEAIATNSEITLLKIGSSFLMREKHSNFMLPESESKFQLPESERLPVAFVFDKRRFEIFEVWVVGRSNCHHVFRRWWH